MEAAMIRRPRLAATILVIAALSAACSHTPLSGPDRAWVGQVNLEVARVNDDMSLEFLPAMLGESKTKDAATATAVKPDWPAVSAACTSLDAELVRVRRAAAQAPARFGSAGRDLAAYADQMAAFASTCRAAVAEQNPTVLHRASASLNAASDQLGKLDGAMPHGIGCPKGVQPRPRSCDNPKG
jgi:hypothetical protein